MATQQEITDAFFDRTEGGSLFACVGSYHHYISRPQQAMMLCEGGDREDRFLRFVHSNIAAAGLCSYVSDARPLR